MVSDVIGRFFEDYKEQSSIKGASRGYLDGMLSKALGSEITRSLLDSIYGEEIRAKMAKMEWLDPKQFAALIAAPSVSCTQPNWDQSNAPVIELLAAWLGASLALPVDTTLLRRSQDTAPQQGLDAASRRRNLRHARSDRRTVRPDPGEPDRRRRRDPRRHGANSVTRPS